MLAAISRLLPHAAKFTRQIVPPVVATLIAAGLISAYNRAFSGHLQQPRMAALHHETAEAAIEPVTRPLAPAEAVATYDNIAPPARLWEKEPPQESGKDQAIKVAAEPPLAPVRTAAPRPEKVEPRAEQRRLAAIETQPVVRSPAAVSAPAVVVAAPPVVAPPPAAPAVASLPTVQQLQQPVLPPPPAQHQQPAYLPPPVITAQPVVTVPDRTRPIEQAQVEAPNAPQGPVGKFVDAMKPSNLFARAREFGDKIEQAGNDILPSIRH
jgi:hypothetical protein